MKLSQKQKQKVKLLQSRRVKSSQKKKQKVKPASEPESETVTETERTLTSVSLKVDQDLESVPVTFLEQLNELDVYSVVLVYSDGSTSLPDKAEEAYDISVDYEDVAMRMEAFTERIMPW